MGRPSTILVTGASGFLGQHLVATAEASGLAVWRLGRSCSGSQAIQADLCRKGEWQDKIRSLQPDAIIHLAGGVRAENRQAFDDAHVQATRNLMEAAEGATDWVMVASSSGVYGLVPESAFPISEDTACAPADDYAASKKAQEAIAAEMAGGSGLKVCLARFSNLIGPRQSTDFFFGRLMGEIERSLSESTAKPQLIEMGSLAATRDFLDVRDAASAVLALMQDRTVGIYNVASGQETLLRDAVDLVLDCLGGQIEVEENPNRFVSKIARQQLDASRLSASTGWTPKYDLRHSLMDMLAAAGPESRRATACAAEAYGKRVSAS